MTAEQQDLGIFLDYGGVLGEGGARPDRWRQLLGEYLVPRYGGTAEAWSAANEQFYGGYWERYQSEVWGNPHLDFNAFLQREQLRWLREQFELIGVEMPPPEDHLVIVHEAHSWIAQRLHISAPGAADAVTFLHRQGYRLHTASGQLSVSLEGYLRAMGVIECFHGLYGPDLVNRPKEGAPFYRRVFEHAGVHSSEAIVVDDTPRALGWAAKCGASCVLVAPSEEESSEYATIQGLLELPALLQKWRTQKSPGIGTELKRGAHGPAGA